MNIAIILGLISATAFLLYKSGWLERHLPRWKSAFVKPDAVAIEQRLQEIAGV